MRLRGDESERKYRSEMQMSRKRGRDRNMPRQTWHDKKDTEKPEETEV